MELTSHELIKKEYLKALSEEADYFNVIERVANKAEDEPITLFGNLNPEDAPSLINEQREFTEIVLDLKSINDSFVEISDNISSLISNIDDIGTLVKESIKKETDRIMDINMICSKDSEYNMVIPIYSGDFNSDKDEFLNEKTIGAKLLSEKEIEYEITSVQGNGYEGNDYVYNDGTFEKNIDNLSNLGYIYDSNDVTAYEYSRLVTREKSEVIDGIINYDNKDLECVMVLYSQKPFCKAKVMSETKKLIIKNLETSNDGITFISRISRPIKINDTEIIYNDFNYIYGSNILCFPYCNYVRITFLSSENTEDVIAIKDENDLPVIYKNTRRKKIKINNIKLYSSRYEDASVISGNIVEDGSVDKIALFANEYIPDHFPSSYKIDYYLVINGTEYKIVPVNSEKAGIRIIKFSENVQASSGITQNISETIKTAKIKINIPAHNLVETGYVSNLKLCLGKDTSNIYV